jgi:hypothetical protein
VFPRKLFHAFLIPAAFLFATQGASGVTAHLAGIAIPALMFFSVFRLFFGFIDLACKTGNLNKGHTNSPKPLADAQPNHR